MSVEKLKQEAEAWREQKQKAFLDALDQEQSRLVRFLHDTLYESREKSLALTKLDEAILWIREAVKQHGIK